MAAWIVRRTELPGRCLDELRRWPIGSHHDNQYDQNPGLNSTANAFGIKYSTLEDLRAMFDFPTSCSAFNWLSLVHSSRTGNTDTTDPGLSGSNSIRGAMSLRTVNFALLRLLEISGPNDPQHTEKDSHQTQEHNRGEPNARADCIVVRLHLVSITATKIAIQME